jgi:two-component system, OmpR family, response regulator
LAHVPVLTKTANPTHEALTQNRCRMLMARLSLAKPDQHLTKDTVHMRILLIEDDKVLQGVVQQSLTDKGHRVDVAGDLSAAKYMWHVQSYDAVLLDLNLPSSDSQTAVPANGLHLLQERRHKGDKTPVLVLTARNRTDERIAGLDAGADDYLGKPFDLAEVDARLRALVRRSQGEDSTTQLAHLVLDRKGRRVLVHDQPLNLPAREFEVLSELMSPPGRTLSKKELSDKLSDFDEALVDNALEAFISRLRKKILNSGATIRTLRGLGYLMEEERP